jgi:hypothetical protein
MFENETKSSSNGREENLNEPKFYLDAYFDKFEKGNDLLKSLESSERDNSNYNDEKLYFNAFDSELEIENKNKYHTCSENFQYSCLDCASDMQNNYQNNTHDSKDKKKNRNKPLKSSLERNKILRRLCWLVVSILNINSKKFNHNIRFRNINPIKLNKNSINNLMKKNIKQFCELEISKRIKRYNDPKMNKRFLQKIKSKWGNEFLKLKLSDIYKKIFLLKTKEKGDYINFPLKKLINKDINNLGNYLIIEKKYIFNEYIKKYEVDDRKLVKQIANELLLKKNKSINF